jgi:3-phenylpropionate/trans-cinnamate dioxygenase ferredoxin component
MTTWVPTCSTDDVDAEDVVPFEHDGREYAIYRSADDEWSATDGQCTHQDADLCDRLVLGTVVVHVGLG